MMYFFTPTYFALISHEYRDLESSFYFLSHANSAINPCLYIFLNQRFNHEFKNVVRSLFCRPAKEDLLGPQSVYQRSTEGTIAMK